MKATDLKIGQKYIWRRNSEVSHEVKYEGIYDLGSVIVYVFKYIKDGEIYYAELSAHQVESDISEIYNVGEFIQFYKCCNSDRKLYEGVISEHEGLGLVIVLEGEIHEVRKMIDIKKLVEII